jgi:hypothetical protein
MLKCFENIRTEDETVSDIAPNSPTSNYSEAAIFGRVVDQSGVLSRELAEHILTLGMSDSDQGHRIKISHELLHGSFLSKC